MNAIVPSFMAPDLPTSMPKLDRDALKVGSPVLVIQGRMRNTPAPILAEVASKARVWIEVRETGAAVTRLARVWRFRLDNQTDGNESYYRSIFRTPEQERYEHARAEADRYLSGQRIRIEYSSPWGSREIELARIIWTAENRGK